MSAQGVNGGIQSRFLLVDGLIVQSLGIGYLGFRSLYPGGGRNSLQIGVSHCQHYHFSSIFEAVLRRLQALGGSAFLLEVLEVEQRLRDRGARVEIVEGTDHPWKGKREKVAFEA